MSLKNSILLMQGVFEDKDFPVDKDFTIWEYRKEIKDLLDHALNNHCIDCCCQRSWEALGLKEYSGKSIPEEIEKIMLENERLRIELEARPQGDFFPNPKRK